MLSDRLVKNERKIKEIIVEQIKVLLMGSPDESCILFGAGIGGSNVFSFICDNIEDGNKKIKCFIDNNSLKYNTDMCGKKVISPKAMREQYKGEVVIISCGEGDVIKEQLISYDIPLEKIYIPDIAMIKENDPEFIWKHLDYFNNFYEELADEKSRNVLIGILNYKLSHDIGYITEIADKPEDQYFDDNLIHYSSEDVFLDCGGYIGDTVASYISHNKGIYDKVICLEADETNCKIIRKMSADYRIELHNVAVYNQNINLHFDKIGSGSGTILEGEIPRIQEIIVKGNSIDEILGGQKVSFIKMDIEGAEYKALLGAVDTIQKFKPRLMISVYHKQDDLIKIPLLIKSLNYDYEFYLRHYRSMSVQETVLYAIDRASYNSTIEKKLRK